MFRKFGLATALLLCFPAISLADRGVVNEFQLIIRQTGDNISSLNMAFGHGTEVTFFSNMDADDVTWADTDGPIRTGTLNSNVRNKPVVLGVCADGKCEVSNGLYFTSPVGDPPQ